MSVFDLPRLHFHGVATTRLPTGPRGGLVDLASNTALTADGEPFPAHRPAAEYHAHLDRLGPRYDAAGRPAAEGPFSAAKGEDFAGSGHFAVDARVVAAEPAAGRLDTADPVVGRAVDMWGHYNEYLATTVNRARVFDVDPASDWTTTLMVGQFCFGRAGRSHDVGYMATGTVHGFQPPRWHNADHPPADPGHGRWRRRRRSVVHQFVTERDSLAWLDEAAASDAVRRLRATVTAGDAGGLVVRFALVPLPAAPAPDRPARWQLRGTIAPWHPHEPRTYPAGRLLTPGPGGYDHGPAGARPGAAEQASAGPGAAPPAHPGPHNLTVELTDSHVTLDMITALPAATGTGATPGSEAAPPRPADIGDLELRTARGGLLLARIPRRAYLGEDFRLSCGLLTVPAEAPARAAAEEGLLLVTAGPGGPVVRLREREVNLQTDEASVFLDHPRGPDDAEHDTEILVRSFVRGRPAAVRGIGVRQFFNPRALPRHPAARRPAARCADLAVVRLRAGGPEGRGEWADRCELDTDDTGTGRLTLRGATAGTTRVLLSAGPHDLPCDPRAPGSAARAHDQDDTLGYWPGAGHLSVRVLPDDWRLAATGPEEATFDLLHTEVFAYYEQLYSFMKAEVFSLADRCKVETYAKLIWQMCDPRNKAKTYYMPPTRDLSAPKARLLLSYLRAQQARDAGSALLTGPPAGRTRRPVTTRGRLLGLLRAAAALELAVMLQYLYAAYSVPTHATGSEYVRRGVWTPRQLALACGDGGATLDEGIRSMLLGVAREEMIHFLLVNNIITALGEPFHIPRIDFATVNHELPVPVDLCLEGLGPGSIDRFVRIERPADLVPDLPRGPTAGPPDGAADGHPYASLSELYADIREGLTRVPGLFLVERGRGGGEHHLFLRESLNRHHPDYQLEVDDLRSALFAVDVITEQGEGGVLGPRTPGESHHATFLRIADLLGGPDTAAAHPDGERWSPAHPVLRNPTLGPGRAGLETVTEPDARTVMRLFNHSYFMALQLMAQHFGQRPDESLRRSDLMNAAIDMMTGLMRPLAELLVTLPAGRRGSTAGPSFELAEPPAPVARPDVARRAIALRLDHLAAACGKCPLVPARVGEMSAFWAAHFRPPDD